MASPPGSGSQELGKLGCTTPVRPGIQHGKAQASPFSMFAADLSPITPSRAGGFDSSWQPPVVSPPLGAAITGGKLTAQTTSNAEGGTQSGGKSSLRCSYETESAGFGCLFAGDRGSSPTQPLPSNNTFPPVTRAAAPSDSETEHFRVDERQKVSNSTPALLGHSEFAPGPETCGVSGVQPSSGNPGNTSRPTQIGTSELDASTSQSVPQVAPTSPFAAIAAEHPPNDWQAEEERRGSKRKSLGPEGQARQRRRTLTFPAATEDSGTPGSAPVGSLLSTEKLSGLLQKDSGDQPPMGAAVLGGSQTQLSMPPIQVPGKYSSALAAAQAAGSAGSEPHPSAGFVNAATPLQSQQQAAVAAAQHPQPPKRVSSSKDRRERESAAMAGLKRCNCKKSRCLKLYCDCFAAGQFCTNCSCTNCSNTAECRDAVMEMRETIQARNSSAFDTKVIQKVETAEGVVSQHKRGCHCKKSHCKKKYCECFQAGVNCGQHCKCENCHNQPEHGLPEPKKSTFRARGDPASRVSSGKLDSGLTGGSEPRRSSARAPKRKTPARQDRDEEASLTSRSARANSSAGEATPFSPPTLVWESQPLYQAPGMTFLSEKDDLPSCFQPALPRSVHGRASHLPQPMREKHQALLRPTSGSFTDGHRLRDGAAGLIRGGEEMMVLMPLASRPPAHQRSGRSSELEMSFGGGAHPEDPAFRMVPLNATAAHQGSFLADLHPSLPYEAQPSASLPLLSRSLEQPADVFRGQVLPTAYFQLAEQFSAAHEESVDQQIGLNAPTPWTEKRMDDLETGEGLQVNLESLMMGSSGAAANLDEHNFLLPTEINQGDAGQDENIAPDHVHVSTLATANFQGFASLNHGYRSSPVPLQPKEQLPSLGSGRTGSPSRAPLGHSHQSAERHAQALAEPAAVAREPAAVAPRIKLEAAPSLNPVGIPALREHRPAPPALPHAALQRARSGEIFQSVLEDTFQGSIFEDPYGSPEGDGPHEPLASYGHNLEHAHSLPTALHLRTASHSHQTGGSRGSPVSRTHSMPPAPGYQHSSGASPECQSVPARGTEVLPANASISESPVRQQARPSPQKSRFMRPVSAKPGASGFFRIMAGSTTIFSPPKSR